MKRLYLFVKYCWAVARLAWKMSAIKSVDSNGRITWK